MGAAWAALGERGFGLLNPRNARAPLRGQQDVGRTGTVPRHRPRLMRFPRHPEHPEHPGGGEGIAQAWRDCGRPGPRPPRPAALACGLPPPGSGGQSPCLEFLGPVWPLLPLSAGVGGSPTVTMTSHPAETPPGLRA